MVRQARTGIQVALGNAHRPGMDLAEVARIAANKLGFTNLKSKQEEVIASFLEGNDIRRFTDGIREEPACVTRVYLYLWRSIR